MEKKQSKLWEKGIIIALLLIILQLVMYFTHNMQNKLIGYLVYIIFLAGILWSCTQYSKEMNGDVTFGNLFSHGFKISAVVALIMIAWTIIMFKVLFPTLGDEMLQMQRTELIKRGMPEEQINMSLAFAKKHFMLFAVGGTILTYAILGALASLIGAAVAKKKPKDANPFNQ